MLFCWETVDNPAYHLHKNDVSTTESGTTTWTNGDVPWYESSGLVFADYANAILTMVMKKGFHKAMVEDDCFKGFRTSYKQWMKKDISEKGISELIEDCRTAGEWSRLTSAKSCPEFFKRRPGACNADTEDDMIGCNRQQDDTCGVKAVEAQMKSIIHSETWQSGTHSITKQDVTKYIGEKFTGKIAPSTVSPLLYPCTSVQTTDAKGATEITDWFYTTPAQVCISPNDPWYRAPSPQNVAGFTAKQCDAIGKKYVIHIPDTGTISAFISDDGKPADLDSDATGVCCLAVQSAVPDRSDPIVSGTYEYTEHNGGDDLPAKGSRTCKPWCPQC